MSTGSVFAKLKNDEAIRELSALRGKNPVEHVDEFRRILDKWSPRAYGGWARNLSRKRIPGDRLLT